LEGPNGFITLGLPLLIGFFYLAGFVAQHTPFEAAVLVFLGLSVFVGLLETSIPRTLPVLLSTMYFMSHLAPWPSRSRSEVAA
jgi:hypothetical protein